MEVFARDLGGQGSDCIVHSAHSLHLALVTACENVIGGGAMYVRACKALMCLVSFGFTDPGTIAQEFVGQYRDATEPDGEGVPLGLSTM